MIKPEMRSKLSLPSTIATRSRKNEEMQELVRLGGDDKQELIVAQSRYDQLYSAFDRLREADTAGRNENAALHSHLQDLRKQFEKGT